MIDLDQLINTTLRVQNEKERAEHEPSGKLSASMLSKPLLEQVLKLIGVPPAPVEDYSLRMFARGHQVEDWVVGILKPKETQKLVEYRNTIGLVDAILEDNIPTEIKSTKSSAFKWVEKEGKARHQHALQAGLYALALGCDLYTVIYLAADDFRSLVFTEPVDGVKSEIDSIITEVYSQLKSGSLPPFLAREEWQNKPSYSQYSDYPDWISLPNDMAMDKLKRTYPDAYRKLRKASQGDK